MRVALLVALALLGGSGPATGQSVLEQSGNIHGVWTLQRWNAAFAFSHRFEFLDGGDELINLPTLTLALGLPLGLTAGLDMTTYSEVIPTKITENETQYWLKRGFRLGDRTSVAGMAGYNTAAESFDGAISARQVLGRLSLFGEARAFSNLFGLGEGGAAGAVGAAVRLTQYLAVTGDVGRVVSADSFPTAWSAGFAMAIPGSPHTLALLATNAGATTLHGASRGVIDPFGQENVRYGFTFTIPLSLSRWGRIFQPVSVAPVAPPPAGVEVAARLVGCGAAASTPRSPSPGTGSYVCPPRAEGAGVVVEGP